MTTKSKTKKGNLMKRPAESKASSSSISKSSGLAETHAGLVFVRRFQNTLAKNNLLPRGSKIIIAVSGGPDSVALFTILVRLRDKHNFTLRAVHVNYGLRGRDSDRDEKLVKKLCEEWSVPLSLLHPNERPKNNIEERLRIIRYRFFERIRKQYGFNFVVTAHTMSDLAETFLLNLLRGSGMAGLSPFERTHSNLARPLLAFNRTEIKAFIETERIPSRVDRSNFSRRFTRNRIRHELLPLLETFNPNIIATLRKTAHILSQKHKNTPSATEGVLG
ncbi:MAG: tRNA lysidine(34) synthetase TilS [Candidatus Moraniibacteriota bacterium]|nr:MAG: tRNA lysidine(34) synthetase TilS [Candidatus Moranbacteria bacterium]